MNERTRTQPFLLSHYRTLRRGLLTLPILEASIREDMAEIGRIVSSERHTDLELELAVQALDLMVGTLEEAVASLIVLEEFAAYEPRFEDLAVMAEIAESKIRDERVRDLVSTTLHVHGGIRQLLAAEKARLDSKLRVYSGTLELAQGRTGAAFRDARSYLEEAEQVHLQTLADYWTERLAAEAEAAGGKLYISGVAMELCGKNPEIAQDLGIDCSSYQQLIPPVIWIIAILCAILCKGDS